MGGPFGEEIGGIGNNDGIWNYNYGTAGISVVYRRGNKLTIGVYIKNIRSDGICSVGIQHGVGHKPNIHRHRIIDSHGIAGRILNYDCVRDCIVGGRIGRCATRDR